MLMAIMTSDDIRKQLYEKEQEAAKHAAFAQLATDYEKQRAAQQTVAARKEAEAAAAHIASLTPQPILATKEPFFRMNNPLMWGAIAGGAAAIVGGVYFISRK